MQLNITGNNVEITEAQRAICTVNAPSLFHCLSGQVLR